MNLLLSWINAINPPPPSQKVAVVTSWEPTQMLHNSQVQHTSDLMCLWMLQMAAARSHHIPSFFYSIPNIPTGPQAEQEAKYLQQPR